MSLPKNFFSKINVTVFSFDGIWMVLVIFILQARDLNPSLNGFTENEYITILEFHMCLHIKYHNLFMIEKYDPYFKPQIISFSSHLSFSAKGKAACSLNIFFIIINLNGNCSI